MATLTDIETEVLYEVVENFTTPENWSGDSELREALCDAIDEIAMVKDFFVVDHYISLKADTAFYSLSLNDYNPLFVRRATLVEQDRRLEPETIMSLFHMSPSWTINRGSPQIYCCPSSDIIVFWPCYATDGGIVKLDVVCTPDHYTAADGFLTIREELEDALIHYGKYHLLLRSGRKMWKALREYKKYLDYFAPVKAVEEHAKAMRKFRFKGA